MTKTISLHFLFNSLALPDSCSCNHTHFQVRNISLFVLIAFAEMFFDVPGGIHPQLKENGTRNKGNTPHSLGLTETHRVSFTRMTSTASLSKQPSLNHLLQP